MALHFFLRLNSTISEKNNIDKIFLLLGTGVIRNIRDCVKEIYPEKKRSQRKHIGDDGCFPDVF